VAERYRSHALHRAGLFVEPRLRIIFGNGDAYPPSVGLPSKAEAPASDVFYIKDAPSGPRSHSEQSWDLGTKMGSQPPKTKSE
jgi:hypothetical protein